MERAKILIIIKTYPTLSAKYQELSCTAGIRENGSWIRLYPIPFRLLEHDKRYRKYQWIEIDIEKNEADPRPESYRPADIDNIKLLDKVDTSNNWQQRRQLILQQNKIYHNKAEIIALAHENKMSLAIFKPTKIIDFIIEKVEPEWQKEKVEAVLNSLKQADLFREEDKSDFKIVSKLPYKFSYRFIDDDGKTSRLMIEDWEIGQLYWNCLKQCDDNEERAIQKVKQKYFDDFACRKDIYLFLGTTREFHIRKARNPYVIIGTFHPPYAKQQGLF